MLHAFDVMNEKLKSTYIHMSMNYVTISKMIDVIIEFRNHATLATKMQLEI